MNDFDFGDLEVNTHRWYQDEFKSEGRKTLFLDADFIPYTVGFLSTDEEYQRYLNGTFDLKDKLDHACFLVRDAMSKAKCDAVKLFLTDSKTNFRLTLTEHYKEQRAEEKPPFWQEVKDWLGERTAAVWSVRNEADDEISIAANIQSTILDSEGVPRTEEMYKLWCNFIIGSRDKDLRIVFGPHVDLNTGEHYFVTHLGELQPHYKDKELNDYQYWPLVGGKPRSPDDVRDNDLSVDVFKRGPRAGEVKTKRVCVGKKLEPRMKKLLGTGRKFFYAQLIMGDTVDNYGGLPNYGMTKAFAMLNDAESEEQCFRIVLDEYRKVYPETWEQEMLLSGRMAHMQTYRDELWEFPYEVV